MKDCELIIDNSKMYDIEFNYSNRPLEFRARGWKVLQTVQWFEDIITELKLDNWSIKVDGYAVYSTRDKLYRY